MKNAFIIIVCISFITHLGSQSLITPFGGEIKSEMSVNYSGGEAIIQTIQNNDQSITQGFQQPFIDGDITSVLNLNVEQINLQDLDTSFEAPDNQIIERFIVFNASGQMIIQKKNCHLIELKSWITKNLNQDYWVSGMYFYLLEYTQAGKGKIGAGKIVMM